MSLIVYRGGVGEITIYGGMSYGFVEHHDQGGNEGTAIEETRGEQDHEAESFTEPDDDRDPHCLSMNRTVPVVRSDPDTLSAGTANQSR